MQQLDQLKNSGSYRATDHYTGNKGRDYFSWQGKHGFENIKYNKHFWMPHVRSEHEILDFGCGGGFLLNELEARRKVGIEINSHAREFAKHLGIETYATLSEASGRFDRILSSHALEHVAYPREALAQMASLLKNDTSRLILMLPLDDWRARGQRAFNTNNMHMHLHTWTPQSLGNLLVVSGLVVETVCIKCHAWPPGRRVLWKLSPWLFHRAANLWSILNKQRQLMAIAKVGVSSV